MMKKFLLMLAFVGTALSFTACGEKEGPNDQPGQLTKMTWSQLVKNYPFLKDYPVYDGEIDNHRYEDKSQSEWKIEYLLFMDYKCDAKLVSDYKAKLEATGFTDNSGGYGLYEKETDTKKLSAGVSYSGGTSAFTFSTTLK